MPLTDELELAPSAKPLRCFSDDVRKRDQPLHENRADETTVCYIRACASPRSSSTVPSTSNSTLMILAPSHGTSAATDSTAATSTRCCLRHPCADRKQAKIIEI
jgi:hypothetical protein